MATSRAAQWDLPTLLHDVPGRVAFGASLAPLTSIRIGGCADALVRVETLTALQQVQAVAREHAIPLFVLGGGSNLLLRDGGLRGIVVLLRGSFRTSSLDDSTATVRVGVGHPLSRLALTLGRQGWGGLEFAYGIPGTVGGAMVMNAGTHLGEMRQVAVSARLLLANGQVQELPASAMGLRYRGSSYPPGAIVLDATLRLQRGDPAQITAIMHESYARRQRTQPLSQPNTGSVFKNPPGKAAGQLIEELGLKGTRCGEAMIAPRHANFIVNLGHATATDVERLIALAQARVQRAYHLTLEPEVHVVGEEK